MFADSRKKKVIFIAHCIQNQNSISDGTAEYPGSIEDILEILIKEGVGIVQMPCPELICLGLDRGNIHGSRSAVVEENTRIRNMMIAEPAKTKIRELARQIVFQIREYQRFNFNVLGIVGINRSPSCGVDTTSKKNREVAGKGLFIEVLEHELQKSQINLPFIGIRAADSKKAVDILKNQIL